MVQTTLVEENPKKKRKLKHPKRRKVPKRKTPRRKTSKTLRKRKTPTFDGKKYTRTTHKHGKRGHSHAHPTRSHNPDGKKGHKHTLKFWGYVNTPKRLRGRKIYKCNGCKKYFAK